MERKAWLKHLMPELLAPILCADHVEETSVELFRKICEMDLEGIVAKRKTAPYREKVENLVEGGRTGITLDLREVDYVDSAALGMVVRCHIFVRDSSGEMKMLLPVRLRDLLGLGGDDDALLPRLGRVRH